MCGQIERRDSTAAGDLPGFLSAFSDASALSAFTGLSRGALRDHRGEPWVLRT